MSGGLKVERRSAHWSPNDLGRVRDWMEREITFVHHRLFTQSIAESQLAKMRPASLAQERRLTPSCRGSDLPRTQHVECQTRILCNASLNHQPAPATIGPGIAFVSGMVESGLLTQAEEVYLFTWMNYRKFRAEQARQRLSLNSPDLSLVWQIEADMSEALSVRNRIVKSNLRLVVSLARNLAVSMDQMAELIGEGSVPLIRAVELFDVSLGNRFSTYATWAARNQMLRCLKSRRQNQDRTIGHDQLWLNCVVDERSSPDEDVRRNRRRADAVERLLNSLSERERCVVSARFGLNGQPRGQSLQDIATNVGLSKERVRQILIHALEKLRGLTSGSSEDLP